MTKHQRQQNDHCGAKRELAAKLRPSEGVAAEKPQPTRREFEVIKRKCSENQCELKGPPKDASVVPLDVTIPFCRMQAKNSVLAKKFGERKIFHRPCATACNKPSDIRFPITVPRHQAPRNTSRKQCRMTMCQPSNVATHQSQAVLFRLQSVLFASGNRRHCASPIPTPPHPPAATPPAANPLRPPPVSSAASRLSYAAPR